MRASLPPGSRRTTLLILFALLLLIPLSTYAQFQTGNVYGKVQGKDGGILPGVTVTLTGVGAPQTTVTDAQGSFRFINLSPGTYGLRAELSGYGSAVRTGVGVRVSQNADVTLTLAPSAAESITVSAEAPLLDVRKTGTGANVSKVELENIPTARDPWVILQQTPGVLMDRMNVGGNQSGQQSGYVSKGSGSAQSTWNVDGVNITDFGATGSSPSYYDFDSFEEMQLTTGGVDPRIQTPGVQINMVTKRGTNEFKGSARGFHTSSAYQATPKIPNEAVSYLKRINQINKIDDDGGEVGGPILRDKLWFWGAYGKQAINILSASLLASGARFQDRTTLKNENLKLNAQPLPSNNLVVIDQYGAKVKLGRNVSTTRFPETGWNQNDHYGSGSGSLKSPTLWKIEDTQQIGSNLYFTGLYSKVQGGFQLIADDGKGCQTFACGQASLPAYRDQTPTGDGAWHRSYLNFISNRPQKQQRVDGSAFVNTGSISHELKFGYGYRQATVASQTGWPGDQYVYNYGSASSSPADTGEVALMREPLFAYSSKSTDLYAGDTILLGNLTLQAGLRYDVQKGAVSSGTAPANSVVPDLLPAISFGAVSGLKWNNVTPRLGLTYALGSDRRTLLRASVSKYVDQLTSGTVAGVSPGSASYLYYYFNDVNKDNVAQRSEIDFNYGLVGFTGLDPKNPGGAPIQFTRWSSSLKAPTTNELIAGVERELLPNLSIGVNGTYRKLNNFLWTIGEKHQGQGDYYSTADYVLAPTQASGKLPNGTSVSLPYYILRAGVSPATFKVITNRPDYHQTYKGVELSATKRMTNRWMLRGNFTFQDWKQQVGPGGIVDPTVLRSATGTCSVCNNAEVLSGSGSGSGSFGGVYINSKWAYSVTGAYLVPVVDASLGFNLNGRQGYALPYVVRVTTPRGEGSKLLLATDVDTFRNDNVRELDLRLAKDIKFAHATGVTLSVDAFNVFNSNTVLQRSVTRLGSASSSSGKFTPLASSNRVTEVLSPRVYRIGARLSF